MAVPLRETPVPGLVEVAGDGPMENQMVRLPPALRERVRERAAAAGVKPSVLYRAYIEAGDAAAGRREQKESK